MITRIVKMTFKNTKIDDFRDLTRSIEHRIRNFPGCEHLDFYQDIHERNVFFTFSRWKSENDLNNYRSSDFFKGTWTKTRAWFADKPEAWSLGTLEEE